VGVEVFCCGKELEEEGFGFGEEERLEHVLAQCL